MRLKGITALLLAMVLLVSLCGCSVKEQDVIGVWQREVLYMEYYGCNTEMIVSFAEDGSFSALLLEEVNHNILNYAGGTWRLEDSSVIAEKTDGMGSSMGTMTFEYDNKSDTILFEGYVFEPVE